MEPERSRDGNGFHILSIQTPIGSLCCTKHCLGLVCPVHHHAGPSSIAFSWSGVIGARRYTTRHNTSISRLVTEFLSQLPSDDDFEQELTPTVKRLLGVAAGAPARKEYRRYLVEKYES